MSDSASARISLFNVYVQYAADTVTVSGILAGNQGRRYYLTLQLIIWKIGHVQLDNQANI